MKMYVLQHTSLLLNYKCNCTITSPFFTFHCQRVQPEELERIKKHYETSEEEEVKLLDKPEQSVSRLLTGMFKDCTSGLLCVCLCVCTMSRQIPGLYTAFNLRPQL